MNEPFIEHVNVTVSDPDKTARMLSDLFGWHVRWSGKAQDGGYTVHVGNEDHYLAVYRTAAGGKVEHGKGRPLNHLGIVVDDLEGTERKAIALGLAPFNHMDYAPGRRFYFFDADGIEYEIVSYGT